MWLKFTFTNLFCLNFSFGRNNTIDQFYAQLKAEVDSDWILEPIMLRAREDLDVDKIPAETRPNAKLFELLKEFGGKMYEGEVLRSFGKGKDAFEKQLKLEMGYGWISQTSAAEMKIVLTKIEEA